MVKPYQIFETLAEVTWKTLSHAHKRRIQLGEDAITAYNLLAIDASPMDSVVIEDTRVDESSKGADWEFWIGSDRLGWVRYAVQAKRLTVSSSRYSSLSHEVGGVPQIDILERYAFANRAAPIYCFYNFVDSNHSWNCTLPYEEEQLGCTITPSRVVRNALSVHGGRTFRFIHARKETFPWRCLVKCPMITGATAGQSPLGAPDVNHIYARLPDRIRRLQQVRDASVLIDAPEVFNLESGLLPKWIGVIDLESDNG